MPRTTRFTSTVRRWLVAVAIVLGLTATSAVAAPIAQAGPICTYTAGQICGKLYNSGSVGIGIIGNWGQPYSKILWPGESSTKYFSDTDGFYVGPGYCATTYVLYRGYWSPLVNYGAGNHKINDSTQLRIKAYRC